MDGEKRTAASVILSGRKGYSSGRVHLGDGEDLMRSRVLVVLDSEAFKVGLDEAMDIDRRVRQIIRVWV